MKRCESPEPHLDHLVIIAIDEADHLFSNKKNEADAFLTYRRIAGLLRHLPIWTVFLSTNSSIGRLANATGAESPSRVYKRQMYRTRPYCALETDVGFRSRLSRPETRERELRKSLKDMSSVAHMSTIGRPLFTTWSNLSRYSARKLVIRKLFLNKPFSTSDPSHVITAVAARINLDTCSDTPQAVEFAGSLVASHLRLAVTIDQSRGHIQTLTPDEPLTSEAVAHLQNQTRRFGAIWDPCLTKFSDVLSSGNLEKEQKGEIAHVLLPFLGSIWRDTPDSKSASTGCNMETLLIP
jgi:hypothetical protein